LLLLLLLLPTTDSDQRRTGQFKSIVDLDLDAIWSRTTLTDRPTDRWVTVVHTTNPTLYHTVDTSRQTGMRPASVFLSLDDVALAKRPRKPTRYMAEGERIE
jgi:hypothetical protein